MESFTDHPNNKKQKLDQLNSELESIIREHEMTYSMVPDLRSLKIPIVITQEDEEGQVLVKYFSLCHSNPERFVKVIRDHKEYERFLRSEYSSANVEFVILMNSQTREIIELKNISSREVILAFHIKLHVNNLYFVRESSPDPTRNGQKALKEVQNSLEIHPSLYILNIRDNTFYIATEDCPRLSIILLSRPSSFASPEKEKSWREGSEKLIKNRHKYNQHLYGAVYKKTICLHCSQINRESTGSLVAADTMMNADPSSSIGNNMNIQRKFINMDEIIGSIPIWEFYYESKIPIKAEGASAYYSFLAYTLLRPLSNHLQQITDVCEQIQNYKGNKMINFDVSIDGIFEDLRHVSLCLDNQKMFFQDNYNRLMQKQPLDDYVSYFAPEGDSYHQLSPASLCTGSKLNEVFGNEDTRDINASEMAAAEAISSINNEMKQLEEATRSPDCHISSFEFNGMENQQNRINPDAPGLPREITDFPYSNTTANNNNNLTNNKQEKKRGRPVGAKSKTQQDFVGEFGNRKSTRIARGLNGPRFITTTSSRNDTTEQLDENDSDLVSDSSSSLSTKKRKKQSNGKIKAPSRKMARNDHTLPNPNHNRQKNIDNSPTKSPYSSTVGIDIINPAELIKGKRGVSRVPLTLHRLKEFQNKYQQMLNSNNPITNTTTTTTNNDTTIT